MRNSYRIILWLTACLVLGLPLSGFAQVCDPIAGCATSSTATIIGPTGAVQVTTTEFVGPQTILTGTLGLCNSSCTIGVGGTCGGARPVLTACAGGTPFTIVPGQVDFDTLTVTQITASQATPLAVPLGPWVPLGSAIVILLLATVWRFRRARR